MMFQSYAVFPHMTVEQNVAYGLKKERMPKRRSRNAWSEMLELVQLPDLPNANPTSSVAASASVSRWPGR